MSPLGFRGHMGPGGSQGGAEHRCSAVCFQAVLHGRVLLISQYSELSSLLGIQAPRSIHHLPNLLPSSFLWPRPSSSMEMPRFYQQNPE